MLNFPEIKNANEPALPKMTLREHARFSVFCLENNPHRKQLSRERRSVQIKDCE
jgi:hypothetical protein